MRLPNLGRPLSPTRLPVPLTMLPSIGPTDTAVRLMRSARRAVRLSAGYAFPWTGR
jgi:hypothetical protein